VRLCRSLLVAALELSLLPSEGVLDLFVTRFCLPHVAGPGRAGADAGCGGGGKDALFVELWKACAGPLSSVPLLGEKVYYFPQGHIEQVRQQLTRRVALLFPLMLPLHPRVFRRGFWDTGYACAHASESSPGFRVVAADSGVWAGFI
jgi:hypothetical protein